MKTERNVFVMMALLAGIVSAAPVDIMIGARGYGFGGAYSAISEDPSAAYWNPAGLASVENVSLMESNWIMQEVTGLNINYVTFAMPLKNVGTVSGSWLYKHASLEEGPDAVRSTAGEHTWSLAMARMLWNKLFIFEKTSLGFSINRHAFYTEAGDGSGLGFDLGLLTKFPYGFSFALVGRNLGADMMGESIDPEVRMGLGYSKTIREMHRITAAIDGLYFMNRDYQDAATLEPGRNNLKGFSGVEYALLYKEWEFALRGGGNGGMYNTMDNYSYAAGIGIKYEGYSFQYAFKGDTEPEAGIGYSHRVDLILELNRLR